MLGRLARWLRVLGFDTLYDTLAPDAALVQRAHDEDRVLLTRDRELLRELRPRRGLEVESDTPAEQLVQVVRTLGIAAPRALFTRCLLCNATLADVGAEERAAVLPPASRGLPGPVRRCPECGRVYWQGSHARRMREELARILPDWHMHEPQRSDE